MLAELRDAPQRLYEFRVRGVPFQSVRKFSPVSVRTCSETDKHDTGSMTYEFISQLPSGNIQNSSPLDQSIKCYVTCCKREPNKNTSKPMIIINGNQIFAVCCLTMAHSVIRPVSISCRVFASSPWGVEDGSSDASSFMHHPEPMQMIDKWVETTG